MKLLTFTIPCYNSQDYMRHCIESILPGGEDVEILIVDEALSVGDVFFQSKCYRRMDELRKNGTTIVMVTHDMGSVIKYCDKVVLLNRGEFVAEGPAGKLVDI